MRPFCVKDRWEANDSCWKTGHMFSWNWEYDQENDAELSPSERFSGKMKNVDTLDLRVIDIRFKDIDARVEGDLIKFKAKIISTPNIKTYNFAEYWFCSQCYNGNYYYANKLREIHHDITCSECKTRLINDKSKNKTANIRQILLQELFEEASEDKDGNISPRVIPAEVYGDLANTVFPGQDKWFLGRYRSRKDKEYNKTVLEILDYQDVEEKVDLTPTESDKRIFESYTEDRIIKSFAPEIWGMEVEKLGLMLGIIGGVECDGLRSLINIFLVGDPSMAKSRLLSYAVKMLRKAVKVSGRMASGAGLVAGIDERDGNRYPVVGPVVLCNNGLVAIDEGDKMNSTDQSALHDVMEERIARLTKIGVNLAMPANTIIFMAANPRKSKYDPDATIKDNINVPESLMSRMGLIFCCRDTLERDQEALKIKHVGRVRKLGIDKLVEEDNLITQVNMMKFLNYCRTFTPELSDEAVDLANKYYLDLKYTEQAAHGTIPIDVRTGEDILRISQAFAKFTRAQTVTTEHVERAWKIVRAALASFGMKTPGEQKQAMLADKHMNKEDSFRVCIEKSLYEENGNKFIRFNDIIMHMVEEYPKYWDSTQKATKFFELNRMNYDILESTKNGVYSCK